MSLQSREDLIAELQRKEFRDAFVSSRVSNTLALQIRAMRQERGWTQAQLAERLGTSQNAIYRLESPRYGKATVTTLKRLASIFDVGLAAWFVPFSELVEKFTNLSTESIIVPRFDYDLGLHQRQAGLGNVRATHFVVSTYPVQAVVAVMNNLVLTSSAEIHAHFMSNMNQAVNITGGASAIIAGSNYMHGSASIFVTGHAINVLRDNTPSPSMKIVGGIREGRSGYGARTTA